MPLTPRVAQALAAKREVLRRAQSELTEARMEYQRALRDAMRLGVTGIDDRLGGVRWPGARPSGEWQERGFRLPFHAEWRSVQSAREWALETLRGCTTVAVDGSQITASRELGIPLSLVQVAWFENFHDEARTYRKDLRIELLSPDGPGGDMALDEIDDAGHGARLLFQRRFVLEMEVAVERLRALDPNPPPVVFVDGTFVLSFTSRMAAADREAYFAALISLLEASERSRIPVVGYVDQSYASDLVTMLRHAFDLAPSRLFDAELLATELGPLDRTCALRCARGDVLPFYRTRERDFSEDIYFVYLQSGAGRLPSRIDFPRWVFEAGLLDHVIDVVRAEVVVGAGFPYAIESADAAAVLTMDDRVAFSRLYSEFAREAGLPASLPSKTLSKLRRRV